MLGMNVGRWLQKPYGARTVVKPSSLIPRDLSLPITTTAAAAAEQLFSRSVPRGPPGVPQDHLATEKPQMKGLKGKPL